MGFFDKIVNFGNYLGSKIRDTANTIADKSRAFAPLLDVARSVVKTAADVARSPAGQAIAQVVPYGQQISRGITTMDDMLQRGSAINQQVQNIARDVGGGNYTKALSDVGSMVSPQIGKGISDLTTQLQQKDFLGSAQTAYKLGSDIKGALER